MSIYLDFNATAPIDERVLDFMVEVYKNEIGNADSRTHDFGENARKIVENARSQIAAILDVRSDEIFFTSGATESNNIALQGLKAYGIATGKKHIITSSIEHKAVLETAKMLQNSGFEVDFVDPDISGRVSPEKITNLIREDTLLVSLMHVNNETGIIQPVKEIGDFLADREIFFHIDATQSFGKLVDELRNIKYNMLSMSAHKIGGPQGIGTLVLRKQRYKLPPVKGIMYGGQQEHGIRPGTIPVALVAGMGKACELTGLEYRDNLEKCNLIKNELCKILDDSGITYEFNGNRAYCVSNTMNIYLKGVASEALMLSTKQYCGISNGSACNSKSYQPSYVLLAMGLTEERIENSIRVSWGPSSNIEEIKTAFSRMIEVAKTLAF